MSDDIYDMYFICLILWLAEVQFLFLAARLTYLVTICLHIKLGYSSLCKEAAFGQIISPNTKTDLDQIYYVLTDVQI
jgi:hypothetical protein